MQSQPGLLDSRPTTAENSFSFFASSVTGLNPSVPVTNKLFAVGNQNPLCFVRMSVRRFLFFALIACSPLVCCQERSIGNRTAAQVDTLEYEVITLTREYRQCHPDSDDCTRILLRFPKFGNVRGCLADSLISLQNRCFVNGDIGVSDPLLVMDFFIRRYEEEVKARGSDAPSWQMEHRLSVVNQTPEWVCLEMLVNGYEGGAHENRNIQYYTLEKVTGRHLSLSDFFDSTSLEKLTRLGESAFCKARDLKPDQSLEEGGFWFPKNRFALPENYHFDPTGITFYFNEYEIGPYAMGETEFTIPSLEFGGLGVGIINR